jgi:hypothetical protein
MRKAAPLRGAACAFRAGARGTAAHIRGFISVQYLIYFAVTTPLLLVWLFWASAGSMPPGPIPVLRSSDAGLHQDGALTERGQTQHYPQFPAEAETTGASSHANKA